MSWFADALRAGAGRLRAKDRVALLMAGWRVGRACVRALDDQDADLKEAVREFVATEGFFGPFAIADVISRAAVQAINSSTTRDIETLGMGRYMAKGDPHPGVLALDPWSRVVAIVAIAALERIKPMPGMHGLMNNTDRLVLVQARVGRVREDGNANIKAVAVVTIASRQPLMIQQSTGPVFLAPSVDVARQAWLGADENPFRPKAKIPLARPPMTRGEAEMEMARRADEQFRAASAAMFAVTPGMACQACGHAYGKGGHEHPGGGAPLGSEAGACQNVSEAGVCACERFVRPRGPRREGGTPRDRPPTGRAGDT